MSQFKENIKEFFDGLATEAEVRAVLPRDFPIEINPRDGKMIGLCNYYKLKRLVEIKGGSL